MKKKILFVVHQLNHGGVQKTLISALNAIDYTENEVTLYVRKNRTELLSDINKNVSRIIVNQDQTHYYRKPYAALCLLGLKISELIKSRKSQEHIKKKLVAYINKAQMEYEKRHYFNNQETYDVAISYIQGYNAQFVAEYVDAKKKVMFFHGSTDEVHELHEKVMPKYDAIVGVNQNIQDILAKLYPMCAEKMTYLENYMDSDMIRMRSTEFGIPKKEGKINLCSCGRFTPVKGFDLAVEAAKCLKENGVDFFWCFVGDGAEREKLEQLISKYGLEKDIQITGMQDNPYPYLNSCDVYVQPSREESHSLTIMEALRLCKPVISTITVGGEFLVKNKVNGMLTDISGEAIAEGITVLSNEKELCNSIREHLEQVDYSLKFEEYKNDWSKLLEG